MVPAQARGVAVRPTWSTIGLALVMMLGGLLTASPVASASPTDTSSGGFEPLPPARLLDTRAGLGATKAPVTPGGTIHLQVEGQGRVPASGVSAVALTLTATGSTRSGYVTAYADGAPRPATSNLNYRPGTTVANLVIAPVAANGKIALTSTSTGTTALIADIAGFYLVDTTAPAPVGAVTVARSTTTTVTLTWTNPASADFGGVLIRRAPGRTPPSGPADGSYVADTAAGTTSFTDTRLTGDTDYS